MSRRSSTRPAPSPRITSALDSPPTITDRDGKVVTITFEPDYAKLVAFTDPVGRSWAIGYPSGFDYQVSKVTAPRQAGAADTLFSYDFANDRTTVTDANGNQVVHTLDTKGRQISATDALGHIQSKTWTAGSDVQSVTDGLSNSTTAAYDTAGNLLSTTLPTGAQSTASYTNTALPNLPTSVKDPAGNETTRQYDALGNLTKVRSTPLAADLEQRTYTGPKGLLATVTDANGNITRYAYDGPGNLITVTPPAPLGVTRYSYDSLSRITSITDGATFAYDNADRRTVTTWPGAGTQTNAFDNSGRLTSLSVKNTGGTETLRATYSYTTSAAADSDLLQSKTIAGVSTAYTYDTQRHLTGAGSATYSVDKADNITNFAGTAYTNNAANQVTAIGSLNLSYDNAGNVSGTTTPTTANEFSASNQFTRATRGGVQDFTAAYDTADQTQPRTITETVSGTTTGHVFTQTALGISSVLDNGTTRTSVSRDPDGKLITEKIGSTRYNLVTDHQGSVLGLVDTTGAFAATYTYLPYGGGTGTGAAAGSNPFRYLGGYTLRGGLALLGYRYYNPNWGRFFGPDPTGQERNTYAYAQSDPINRSDPRGDYSQDDFEDDLGFVASSIEVGAIGGAGIGCVVTSAGCPAGAAAGGLVGGLSGLSFGISYSITKRILGD
ncbi:RHS repeat-associated core domain-containing protein [Actinokineospora globicatena]|uniref:RHS repeat-associated core domain-containing protein n=1 Tax=Actinokineospora globicatena TaxID=103729 RepID=UPI0020A2DA25|nr:RHS repeat-associated core domain-containing protein [Actinokineospora globicatena]MCP2303867.1 RHS repeat-associated core domain-containing protein [Actinokineospora globicatena]GLW78975.1 hypothetical protein Aglo01_34570 [Actinokineospora globicatena]GLW86614.1 hypothetical protein Aglo02_42530 [Actinokineospora globicatena]